MDCDLVLELDQEGPHVAGEPLTGRLVVHAKRDVRFHESTVTLAYVTTGRGAVDRGGALTFKGGSMRVAAGETASIPFELVVPDGPITMRGTLLGVAWRLRAQVAIPWAFDPVIEREIVVVPRARETTAGAGYRDPPRHLESASDGPARPGAVSKSAAVLAASFGALGIFMILHWRSRSPETGDYHVLQIAILVGFVLFTIWRLVGRSVRNRIAEHGLGAPRVEVTPGTIARGELLGVMVSLRPAEAVVVTGIEAKLRCTEKTSTGRSDGQSARKHVAHAEIAALAEGVALAAGQERRFEAALRVPADALPTLALLHHDVVWEVEVVIRQKAGADHLTETALVVLA